MIDHRFPYAHSAEAQHLCDRVLEAMTAFCPLSRERALEMMRQYWADIDDIEADPLLYGEPPYYYAMCIAHHPTIGDDDPEWYRDRRLWPSPPGWCLE